MAGALRKTMVYLGLAEEDDSYDRYDDGYDERRRDEAGAPVTQLPTRNPSVARVVREHDVGPLSRITTIHPRTYNEAKRIGESFREGTPVIMNLSDMDDADAKRLVDFAAGLVFGLRGSIERVTAKVFLLSPEHVEIAAEEPTGARAARGPFNQS
jgi:cell division inhibitor SepF